MALSGNTVWEVRTTGSDTNGGGFVEGASGTDWSQQDAAQYAVTDGVTAGTTTITSATANFGTDVVGNIMYVQGGTGGVTAGWYQITARASSTSITVDRSTGLTAGTGVTLNIGGALATPGRLSGNSMMVSNNQAWVKAGTYTITTATAGPSGPLLYNTTTGQNITVAGYSTTRGDMGKFTFDAGAVTAFTMVALNDSSGNLRTENALANCILLGNGNATVNATTSNSGGQFFNVEAYDCVAGISGYVIVGCYSEGCSGNGFVVRGSIHHSVAKDNAINFNSLGGVFYGCISINGSSYAFRLADDSTAVRCVAYNSASIGFSAANTGDLCVLHDCIAMDCLAGFDFPGPVIYDNCAYYSNTTDVDLSVLNTTIVRPFIALSADPFTSVAGDDFSLNDDAGGGALLKGLSIPPFGQTSALDIGAVQSAGGGGGGTVVRAFA